VRLGSLEPDLLTDEVLMRLCALPKLCPQFHLSLQSGCDDTLGRMRRLYTSGGFRRTAHMIRGSFDNPAITTDIMVGFPGESAEEFAQSLAFVEEIGFARAHVFAYSPRPSTLAAEMPEQIPRAEKARRSKLMTAATDKSQREFLVSQVGKTAAVLFESQRPDGMWEGYSENYTRVVAASAKNIVNEIIPTRLTAAQQDACTGAVTAD
jgi:threonylcarbamoyladenosine tRNA methylthiotransferase MtaB